MEFAHVSVMPNQVIDGLAIDREGIYVDCTLGGGGHSLEILKRLDPGGRLVAFDQDPAALAYAGNRLEAYQNQVILVRANFIDLRAKLADLGIDSVQGILFDLGASSYQFDRSDRGFSYMHDGVLDMRMDPDQELTARDLVNQLPKNQLIRIFQDYGEERWAARIAEFICAARNRNPILTTADLVQVIKNAVPAGARRRGSHPAKRVFQALRIATNRELEILGEAIRAAVAVLAKGGRICVISFHSLEERIVKEAFRELAASCICPKELPVCMCGKEKVLRIITSKPLVPSKEEMEANPRSRSAKLRIGERC